MGTIRIKDPAIKRAEIEATASRLTLEDKLRQSITDNKAYLDLTAPTAQQRNDQIAALTRQMTRLIRLQLRQFDSAE